MKWYGSIGFAIQAEVDPINHPSVYKSQIVEKHYYGDVLQNGRRYENSQVINDNMRVDAKISLIADPYMTDHLGDITYVSWLKSKWRVSNVAFEYPRITLTLGGLYNGQVA